jgi:hypothetical protein
VVFYDLLEILAEMPGGLEEEREIHLKFSKHKFYKEWFNPSEEVMQFINDVATSFGFVAQQESIPQEATQ